MKLALSANVREWWTRTAAKRRKNAAHGASRGRAPTESQPWRGGRQMSHTCGNILLHLIFSTRERHPLIKPEFRSELFAYLGGIVREMHGTALIISGTADHVHMLVRTRPARAPAELAWRRKNKFLSLGSRKMEPKFWMANRLRSFQRQRIECRGGDEIYRQPGRTSQ